jgi:hypothetical protein
MTQSPELQSKIATWRAKQADGSMTIADWIDCFKTLRAARMSAQAASAASKARKAPVDTGALKDSLKALRKDAT